MKHFQVKLIINATLVADKIVAIKGIREMFGLGLKEAKDFVEQSLLSQTVLITEAQAKNLVFFNFMRGMVGNLEQPIYISEITEHSPDIRDLRLLGEAV